MTTPADWYPDPQDPNSLRYWDGNNWTEHRAPAVAPSAPPASAPPAADPPSAARPATETEPPAAQVPEPEPDDVPSEAPVGGAHRAPDADQEGQQPAQPPQSYEPYQGYQESREGSYPGSYGPAPYEAAPYASSATSAGPTGPNKKLAFGIIGVAGAILLAIVVAVVFVTINKNDATVTTAQTTSSTTSSESTTSSSSETTSETTDQSSTPQTTTPPPPGAQGADGDYSFSVTGIETGDTITSNVSDSVESTAEGIFYVVHLNVANTGSSSLTFVATFQTLNAAGQTFPLDDTATAFLGGTVATIEPGASADTSLVYDVPVGTQPDSILLKADPSTAGVELPLK